MKKFSKIFAILLCLVMVISLVACSGTGENTPPVISGVKDASVEAGKEFDALSGVTATDAEDGDITSKIVITSMPELEFKNGKVTVAEAGTYELTYSVTDKGGETAEAYATLVVTRETGEATILHEMDFSTVPADAHGWEASIAEGVNATGALKNGAFVFEIGNPGDGDGAIQLKKGGIALKAADYRVKVWAKSTKDTYAHILARNENAEGWETFGGEFNVRIGTEITPLELFFTSSGEGSMELLINLGKITPNPDNAADTTPEDFTVTIDKIEIYEISGEEQQVPVYTNDYAEASTDAVTVSAGDGASASASCTGNGTGVFQIDNYPTEGGIWSIKADLGIGGNAIENGQKYYYIITLKAEKNQVGELLVESATQNDAARADFNSLNLTAGEEITITHVFTAGNSVSDPVIRMQIGNPADGVTSNTITVTKLEFGRVEGDKETVKTIDSFSVPRVAEDYSWGTYNGTDEDNDRGVGTIWTEDGHFFYRIDQGGTTDWHNKLYMNLTLPSDSYFTIEIKVKASKNVSCSFFLNPAGNWDPRVSEGMDITTEEKTFTFNTTDTLILDMDFEILFQFGSAELVEMGEVTIEFTSITIYQRSVV